MQVEQNEMGIVFTSTSLGKRRHESLEILSAMDRGDGGVQEPELGMGVHVGGAISSILVRSPAQRSRLDRRYMNPLYYLSRVSSFSSKCCCQWLLRPILSHWSVWQYSGSPTRFTSDHSQPQGPQPTGPTGPPQRAPGPGRSQAA